MRLRQICYKSRILHFRLQESLQPYSSWHDEISILHLLGSTGSRNSESEVQTEQIHMEIVVQIRQVELWWQAEQQVQHHQHQVGGIEFHLLHIR